MLKVGPSWRSGRILWDHKGKTDIAKIIISRSETCINFIHFLYVEDGGKLVLSEKIGGGTGGTNFLNTITLDYPCEVITGVTGKYGSNNYGKKRLISVTIVSNMRNYGPIEVSPKKESYKVLKDDDIEFEYYVGSKQFGGFFGTYDSDGIESIGIYLNPLDKLPTKNE